MDERLKEPRSRRTDEQTDRQTEDKTDGVTTDSLTDDGRCGEGISLELHSLSEVVHKGALKRVGQILMRTSVLMIFAGSNLIVTNE